MLADLTHQQSDANTASLTSRALGDASGVAKTLKPLERTG